MKIKAVQLDLARQKENLDYIRSFIEFISRWGFNTLVLYLEAIIRTKSFPWVEDEYAYEASEIKEIVAYAAEFKIDVMPVVSTKTRVEWQGFELLLVLSRVGFARSCENE